MESHLWGQFQKWVWSMAFVWLPSATNCLVVNKCEHDIMGYYTPLPALDLILQTQELDMGMGKLWVSFFFFSFRLN